MDTYQTSRCNAASKTFSYSLVIFRIKSVPTKPIASSSSRGSIWRHNIEISASTSSRKNTPDSEDNREDNPEDTQDYSIDPDNPCYNNAKPQYITFWGFCVLLVGVCSLLLQKDLVESPGRKSRNNPFGFSAECSVRNM